MPVIEVRPRVEGNTVFPKQINMLISVCIGQLLSSIISMDKKSKTGEDLIAWEQHTQRVNCWYRNFIVIQGKEVDNFQKLSSAKHCALKTLRKTLRKSEYRRNIKAARLSQFN